jgi:hypothetical protein
MSPDDSIGYEFAGKGAKARRQADRLTLDTIPKRIARPKPKPEYRRNQKPRAEEREEVTITERGLKRRIARYTLQLANVTEISERLDREGYGPRSKVLIASVRNNALEVIKLMIDENIITEDDLDRYRRRCARVQRERLAPRD